MSPPPLPQLHSVPPQDHPVSPTAPHNAALPPSGHPVPPQGFPVALGLPLQCRGHPKAPPVLTSRFSSRSCRVRMWLRALSCARSSNGVCGGETGGHRGDTVTSWGQHGHSTGTGLPHHQGDAASPPLRASLHQAPPPWLGPASFQFQAPPPTVGSAPSPPQAPPPGCDSASSLPQAPPPACGSASSLPQAPPLGCGPASSLPQAPPPELGSASSPPPASC